MPAWPVVKKYLKKFIWIVPVAAAVALYWHTVHFGFIWDDTTTILKFVPRLKGLFSAFTPMTMPLIASNYYRPLFLFFLKAEQLIWGLNPVGNHIVSIFFHAINVMLVYFVTRRILSARPQADIGAVCAALIFAVHPVQTEVVCWISAMPELLFTMMTLVCFWAFINYRGTRAGKWLILSVVCWLLALLSKETAASLLLCMVVYDVFFVRGERKKTLLAPYVLFIAVFLLYLFLRGQYLERSDVALIEGLGPVLALKRILLAYGFYIYHALLPISLYTMVLELPESQAFLFSASVMLLSLLAIAITLFRDGDRLPLYLTFFFLITLSPSVIVALTEVSNVPVADRYLYFPLYAICIMTGSLFISYSKKRYIQVLKWMALVVIVALFSYKTFTRSFAWENDYKFFNTIALQNPTLGFGYISLGVLYQAHGDYRLAIEYYNKALLLKNEPPWLVIIYSNIAAIYINTKRYDEAEKYLLKATQQKLGSTVVFLNLAKVYLGRSQEPKYNKREMLEEAKFYYDRYIQSSPGDEEAKRWFQQYVGGALEANDVR